MPVLRPVREHQVAGLVARHVDARFVETSCMHERLSKRQQVASPRGRDEQARVLDARRHGPFTVYSVDPYRALLFVREAMSGVLEQLQYLETRLVQDMSWADLPE